jgi:hypothetical protein
MLLGCGLDFPLGGNQTRVPSRNLMIGSGLAVLTPREISGLGFGLLFSTSHRLFSRTVRRHRI